MKNIEYIRHLPIEQLAEILVKNDYYDNGDYHYYGAEDDEVWESNYEEQYIGLDGYTYTYKEDCIIANIEWLNKEYKGGMQL